MSLTSRRLLNASIVALAVVAATGPARAHPHVFVDAMADLVFDESGKLSAVRNVWRFDDAYSAFATQGLDTNGDGTFSTEELKPLADINIESLKDFGYFTFGNAGDKEIDFKEPTQYWLQYADGLLTLYFTLPLKEAAEIRSLPALIDVYDPTYYVSFEFVEDNPVSLEKPPADCKITINRPEEFDPTTAAALAQIGPEQRELPPELQMVTVERVNGVSIACP